MKGVRRAVIKNVQKRPFLKHKTELRKKTVWNFRLRTMFYERVFIHRTPHIVIFLFHYGFSRRN